MTLEPTDAAMDHYGPSFFLGNPSPIDSFPA